MKKLSMLILLAFALTARAQCLYLEVREICEPSIEGDTMTFVRLEVASVDAARAIIADVVAEYFTGLEYTQEIHYHNQGPNFTEPCELVPLRTGLSKYVEVSTIPDAWGLAEVVRVEAIDKADADKKADKIKKKWFKDKPTKTKEKLSVVHP